MNKRQINQLRMFRTVRDFVESISDALKSAPMYPKLIGRYDELLLAIEHAADYQVNGLSGKKEAQLGAQMRMLDMLDVVGGVLHAYSKSVGNDEVKAKTKFKRGPLERMRLADSLRVAEHIYEHAFVVREQLSEYWLDGKDKLADFRVALDAAKTALGDRYQSVATRVSVRKELKRLFVETEGFLTDELDNFLEQYLITNPEALERYVSVRQTRWFGMRRWRRPKPGEQTQQQTQPNAASAPAGTQLSTQGATTKDNTAPALLPAPREGNGAMPAATNTTPITQEVTAG